MDWPTVLEASSQNLSSFDKILQQSVRNHIGASEANRAQTAEGLERSLRVIEETLAPFLKQSDVVDKHRQLKDFETAGCVTLWSATELLRSKMESIRSARDGSAWPKLNAVAETLWPDAAPDIEGDAVLADILRAGFSSGITPSLVNSTHDCLSRIDRLKREEASEQAAASSKPTASGTASTRSYMLLGVLKSSIEEALRRNPSNMGKQLLEKVNTSINATTVPNI